MALLGPGFHVTASLPTAARCYLSTGIGSPGQQRKLRSGNPKEASESLQVEQFLIRSHRGPTASLTHFQDIKAPEQAHRCRENRCQSNQHRKGTTGYLPIAVLVVSGEADEVNSSSGLWLATIRHGNDL